MFIASAKVGLLFAQSAVEVAEYPIWEPRGWVYHAWPYAYSISEQRWFYFKPTDTQWRYDFSERSWSTLADVSGWNYYAWPYAYARHGIKNNSSNPTALELRGDTLSFNFTTGGHDPITAVFDNDLSVYETNIVNGGDIDLLYSDIGQARTMEILQMNGTAVGTVSYAYVLDIVWTNGLNATFTGTYNPDRFEPTSVIEAVSGTITVTEGPHGAWHWHNPDVQWVVDLVSNTWARLGASGD